MPRTPAVPILLSLMMASRDSGSLPPMIPSMLSARPSICSARVIRTEFDAPNPFIDPANCTAEADVQEAMYKATLAEQQQGAAK